MAKHRESKNVFFLPTYVNRIDSFATYLEAINKKGGVKSKDESEFMREVKRKVYSKNPKGKDTHSIPTLRLYGLVELVNSTNIVTCLGNSLIDCMKSKKKKDNEELRLQLMFKMLFSWEVETTDGVLHPGRIIVRLLCDKEMDHYITNHELAEYVANPSFTKDEQYDEIKKFILTFRQTSGISRHVCTTKSETFLNPLASSWGICEAPTNLITDEQKEIATKFFNERNKQGSIINDEEESVDAVEVSTDSDCPQKLSQTEKNYWNWWHHLYHFRLRNGLAYYYAIKFLKFYQTQKISNQKLKPLGDTPHQRIVFGAPGTGKSNRLSIEANEYFYKNCVERVTFHPNYAYSHFVGSYKPTGKGNDIEYKFVEGPFLRILSQAMDHPDVNYLLLIEEINRANVAAVFGDVFQLLDRTSKYESEYPIAASKDIRNWFRDELHKDVYELSIPKNMYIWATMNSADQGVMPLDTAFKRRWEFEYTELKFEGPINLQVDNQTVSVKDFNELEIPLQTNGSSFEKMSWNIFRTRTNNALKELGINEDKCLGPFFIDAVKLYKVTEALKAPNKANKNAIESFRKYFCNKVLMYLYEDAAKVHRPNFFSKKHVFFSEICDDFEKIGADIFNKVYWKP